MRLFLSGGVGGEDLRLRLWYPPPQSRGGFAGIKSLRRGITGEGMCVCDLRVLPLDTQRI